MPALPLSQMLSGPMAQVEQRFTAIAVMVFTLRMLADLKLKTLFFKVPADPQINNQEFLFTLLKIHSLCLNIFLLIVPRFSAMVNPGFLLEAGNTARVTGM